MLKLIGIDESQTTDTTSVLPGYMLRLVIVVAGLGVAFTVVIIINALVLDTSDRGGLQQIGSPVVCVAAGAMLLLIAGVCKDVETPKSCCPKCSRLRTGGFFVLLCMVVPLSHLAFTLAIAGVVLAWLVSIEGVATRLRVVAVVEVILGLILTELIRRAGAWSDGYTGGIILATYAFGSLFLPALLVFGTVGERPRVARASCIGCAIAALHAAAIVLSGVASLFTTFLSNQGMSLHDERCITLELDTPIMWFEKIVSDSNTEEVNLPARYRSKGDVSLPCIPRNVTKTVAQVSMSKVSEDDGASLGAAMFFLIVAIYAIAVVITCSIFVKDRMLMVAPRKAEGEEEEGEDVEGDERVEQESYEEGPPKPRMVRLKNWCVKKFTLSPQSKERIKHLLKQFLGSTARLLCLGAFVMSAIGILVLWDVVVAKPESRTTTLNPNRRTTTLNPNRRVQARDFSVIDSIDFLDLDRIFLDQDRRLQDEEEDPETLEEFVDILNRTKTTEGPSTTGDTTMAPPTTAALGAAAEEVENKIECFSWCADIDEPDLGKRCTIPGCTRCSICPLENCADWCLDVYPNMAQRCDSLACVNCPECELKPCGEDETTTAGPTPPARVARAPSETPFASLPEEYISVTWCKLGPWAAIAVGALVFSFHVLACSLAGEWSSRFEGQTEDDSLEDPNSAEVQARMPKPGFSSSNMLKREPQPAPARLGPNNVRVFNI